MLGLAALLTCCFQEVVVVVAVVECFKSNCFANRPRVEGCGVGFLCLRVCGCRGRRGVIGVSGVV